MTSTARRRWVRELDSEIDGIAMGADGPVLVHGYDAPAGGMWTDEAIPGKLGAMDRTSGETLWSSPCEVGYGRGFGAGFCGASEVIVLGPSTHGHRIVRMDAATGKLLGAESIEAFDEALVAEDVCICANASTVFAIATSVMKEAWRFSLPGHRIHQVERSGERVLVLHSDKATKQKGVLSLDAVTGSIAGTVVAATLSEAYSMVVDGDQVVLLSADVAGHLPGELAGKFLGELSQDEDDFGDMSVDRMTLLGFSLSGTAGVANWYHILATSKQEMPDVSITADSGKLYIADGALVCARDLLTGRTLGDWTIPGLDEQVGWQVSHGAGLLAEEHRLSIFELPA
jgi:hypothetical protein